MEKKRYRKTFTYDGLRYEVTAKTKRELEDKIEARKAALKSTGKILDREMTVTAWINEWIRVYKEPIVSGATMGIIETITKRINDNIGAMKLSNVKPIHIQTMLNGASGLSQSYLDKLRFYTKDIFEKSKKNNLVHDNPADDVNVPKGTRGSHRALTDYERKIFLKVCETHKYGLWGLVMFYCGLRPGETAELRGKDIDLKNRVLHIFGTKTDNAVRDVPMPNKLAEAFIGIKLDPFGYVFTDQNGNQLSKTSRKRMWGALWKAMNIEAGAKTDYGEKQRLLPPYTIPDDLTNYCLRHNFCTMLAEANVPITSAAKLMGHSSPAMTMSIYTHVSNDLLDNARQLLDAAWG